MKKATGKTKAITNKGKAKAATGKKKVSTAKTAKSGPKPAVMNRRKYNEAISGDTMNGSSMYRRGGKVKKYEEGKQVASTDSTNYYAQQTRNALKRMTPSNPASETAYDKAVQNQLDYEIRKSKRPVKKAGGSTKAKKFAALAPPYDKVTFADKIAGAKKK